MRNARSTLFVFAVAVAGWAPRSDAVDGDGGGQVAEGQKLYGKDCARCHGDAGQGTKKAPPVVGKDGLPLDPNGVDVENKTIDAKSAAEIKLH